MAAHALRNLAQGASGVVCTSLFALGLLACAEGELTDAVPHSDTSGAGASDGGDTGTPGDTSAAEDTGSQETAPADTGADTGPAPADVPDVPAEPLPEDTQRQELAGECAPFSEACTEDGFGIQRCSADGELFAPSPCEDDEICNDGATGPECVPCVEGVNCRSDEVACEPNQPFCADFQTAASCTSDGRVGAVAGCQPGRCFGGGCRTSGNQTGEACSAGSTCVGQSCLCIAGGVIAPGEGPCGDPDMLAGYCTTSSCHLNGCEPENEICVDFSESEAFGSDRFCVLRENCSARLGSCQGAHRGSTFVCRSLPTPSHLGEDLSWELGCWVPPPAGPNAVCAPGSACLSPIGGACTDNADCIGGLCLHDGDLSYCAATCSETRHCPGYAACVSLESGSDSFFCLARASESACPRLPVEVNFDIVSRPLTQIDGVSTAQVCFFRE